MPPVDTPGESAFRKDVDFVAKDESAQEATGVVMVPDKADLQNDFAREDTIRGFASQFETFVDAGEASGGVMHAAWPDDWMRLKRNEVLNAPVEIGGTEAPAGAWVQTWGFEDDGLWGLVDDGVLEGYSIGAVDVEWNGPFEPGEVENVAVPDALGDDPLVWELAEGIIREVSAVDIPAVPDAEILETKTEAHKRLSDHLGNRDAFVQEAMDRGHSEEHAERLWDELMRAVEAEGAGRPGDGSESMLARAGKAFLSALSPGAGPGVDDEVNASATASDSPDADTDTDADADADADAAATATATDGGEAAKAGEVLAKRNRDAVMATVDAGLDVLRDAGVDDVPKRFTDRGDVDFNLSEHRAREWGDGEPADEDEGDDADEDDEAEDGGEKHASRGEIPGADTDADSDTESSTSMSDGTDDDETGDAWSDAPAWAKDLRDAQEQNTERISDLAEQASGEKAAGDDSGEDGDAMADAPAWAKALAEAQAENAERIDAISKQSGFSDQLADGAGTGESEDETGLDSVGKLLS